MATLASPDSAPAVPRVSISSVSHWFNQDGASPNDPDHGKVLDDVTLDVQDGEFVSLIGPSGCGKTTLLNAIAGFVLPSVGTVEVDSEQVHGVQGERVSFMFARDTLMPWRTALGNVTLPMECGTQRTKLSRAERNERARELLKKVHLHDAEHKYPHQLSHGMRQRNALARTLACDSDIILMDEPFGALDAQTRVLVQNEFANIKEEFRRTVLMVTHDLTEAIALSDRIVVMSRRPARIKKIYTVDLPRPRNALDLPKDPRFHELFSAMWEDLRVELPDVD
ncbi:ABC transporter ATP-binding protein [Rhodococcus opacus]|nr:ABC transporter ATP-binding protein [Rhodococcus opacus]